MALQVGNPDRQILATRLRASGGVPVCSWWTLDGANLRHGFHLSCAYYFIQCLRISQISVGEWMLRGLSGRLIAGKGAGPCRWSTAGWRLSDVERVLQSHCTRRGGLLQAGKGGSGASVDRGQTDTCHCKRVSRFGRLQNGAHLKPSTTALQGILTSVPMPWAKACTCSHSFLLGKEACLQQSWCKSGSQL